MVDWTSVPPAAWEDFFADTARQRGEATHRQLRRRLSNLAD